MIRNDARPVEKYGYEATGEGSYATCPDHGSRMWWHHEGGYFYCPSQSVTSPHDEDDNRLAPADVYVEHDEAWRVVNGCLWVDTYDEDVTR